MYILAGKSEAGANDSLRAFAWLFTVSRFSEGKLKEDNNNEGRSRERAEGGRKEQLILKLIHVFMEKRNTRKHTAVNSLCNYNSI